jgi:hypothetical protein
MTHAAVWSFRGTSILGASGLVYAAMLCARNLSLRQYLPASQQAGEYSLIYAASGLGYAACGGLSGAVLSRSFPGVALLAGAAATLLLGLISSLAERYPPGPTWNGSAPRETPGPVLPRLPQRGGCGAAPSDQVAVS